VKQRAKTMRDGAKAASFALLSDDGFEFDQVAAQKHLMEKDCAGLKLLDEVHDRLGALDPFDPQLIHVLLEQIAQQKGVGMGGVAQPIRVAMTGTTVSPPLGETLAVIGKRSVLARITRCIAAHTT
jgi:glutamyl-tRNA synthetase